MVSRTAADVSCDSERMKIFMSTPCTKEAGGGGGGGWRHHTAPAPAAGAPGDAGACALRGSDAGGRQAISDWRLLVMRRQSGPAGHVTSGYP